MNAVQDEKSAQGWIYNMTQFTGKSCNHCTELHCLPAALLLCELMESKWGNTNTASTVSFLHYSIPVYDKRPLEVISLLIFCGTVVQCLTQHQKAESSNHIFTFSVQKTQKTLMLWELFTEFIHEHGSGWWKKSSDATNCYSRLGLKPELQHCISTAHQECREEEWHSGKYKERAPWPEKACVPSLKNILCLIEYMFGNSMIADHHLEASTCRTTTLKKENFACVFYSSAWWRGRDNVCVVNSIIVKTSQSKTLVS